MHSSPSCPCPWRKSLNQTSYQILYRRNTNYIKLLQYRQYRNIIIHLLCHLNAWVWFNSALNILLIISWHVSLTWKEGMPLLGHFWWNPWAGHGADNSRNMIGANLGYEPTITGFWHTKRMQLNRVLGHLWWQHCMFSLSSRMEFLTLPDLLPLELDLDPLASTTGSSFGGSGTGSGTCVNKQCGVKKFVMKMFQLKLYQHYLVGYKILF